MKAVYLLDESCVATWMVSNVHITMMNGMTTWKNKRTYKVFKVETYAFLKHISINCEVWGYTVVPYLPHHQPSHKEGIEDSEETINRRWVKTGRNLKKAEDVSAATN